MAVCGQKVEAIRRLQRSFEVELVSHGEAKAEKKQTCELGGIIGGISSRSQYILSLTVCSTLPVGDIIILIRSIDSHGNLRLQL